MAFAKFRFGWMVLDIRNLLPINQVIKEAANDLSLGKFWY